MDGVTHKKLDVNLLERESVTETRILKGIKMPAVRCEFLFAALEIIKCDSALNKRKLHLLEWYLRDFCDIDNLLYISYTSIKIQKRGHDFFEVARRRHIGYNSPGVILQCNDMMDPR